MKNLILNVIIVFFGCVGLACSKGHSPVTNSNFVEVAPVITQPTNKTETNVNNSKCEIDFKNFTYSPAYPETKEFTLKDGKAEATRSADGRVVGMGYNLVSVYYGDLAGNEQKEAIVTISINTGGSSVPLVSYIFDTTSNKPNLLWKKAFGDRANDGLRNIYTDDRKLIIETYKPSSGVGDCCSSEYVLTSFSWQNRTFKETEKKTILKDSSEEATYIGKSTSCQ
ncbi:MAG TPA: hypothetical protein VGC97_07870 [Pyrinomonadaceae bacterium]|jgi:hypothetical protein